MDIRFNAHLKFKHEFLSHYRQTPFSIDFTPFWKRETNGSDLFDVLLVLRGSLSSCRGRLLHAPAIENQKGWEEEDNMRQCTSLRDIFLCILTKSWSCKDVVYSPFVSYSLLPSFWNIREDAVLPLFFCRCCNWWPLGIGSSRFLFLNWLWVGSWFWDDWN